jgi:hypothetical protein
MIIVIAWAPSEMVQTVLLVLQAPSEVLPHEQQVWMIVEWMMK